MKKRITILAILLLNVGAFQQLQTFAQIPEKMSYQAVVRDAHGNLLINSIIGMQISILQGYENGAEIYSETHTITSNENGLVTLEIGTGYVQSSDFSTINWANGPYFLRIETDPKGGVNYTISGTNQLLSVPFALHAKTADSFTGAIQETDPIFNAWDKSTGILITKDQITDLSFDVFEKELANGENNIDVGFTLLSTSIVFYNGNILPTNFWSGEGTQILNLSIEIRLYDKLKITQ